MRVLLVEDSGTMRSIIRRSLKELDVLNVVEADNGLRALEFFRNGEFDLIITDWNMPEKDGLEMMKEIRAVNKKIPIVMITTENGRHRVKEAIQLGVTDYLIKPFSSEALSQKLELATQLMPLAR